MNDADIRTMAPPAPDVTANAGYTIRAVLPGHPAEAGLLQSWWVAAEDTETGQWVTWEAYKLDGSKASTLAYNGGHYYPAEDKRDALADLAVRAGLMTSVAVLISYEMTRPGSGSTTEDRRAARRLRTWAKG